MLNGRVLKCASWTYYLEALAKNCQLLVTPSRLLYVYSIFAVTIHQKLSKWYVFSNQRIITGFRDTIIAINGNFSWLKIVGSDNIIIHFPNMSSFSFSFTTVSLNRWICTLISTKARSPLGLMIFLRSPLSAVVSISHFCCPHQNQEPLKAFVDGCFFCI